VLISNTEEQCREEVYRQIRISSEQLHIEIVVLNELLDHVYLLAKAPPKLSVPEVIDM